MLCSGISLLSLVVVLFGCFEFTLFLWAISCSGAFVGLLLACRCTSALLEKMRGLSMRLAVPLLHLRSYPLLRVLYFVSFERTVLSPLPEIAIAYPLKLFDPILLDRSALF